MRREFDSRGRLTAEIPHRKANLQKPDRAIWVFGERHVLLGRPKAFGEGLEICKGLREIQNPLRFVPFFLGVL